MIAVKIRSASEWFIVDGSLLIEGEFQEPGFRIEIEHPCVAHFL